MPHLTKWYRSDMAGAPALGTGYGNDPTQKGQMNAVIRACLIEGFNTQAVLAANMAYSAGTDRVTVDFGVSHGYLEHQIIEISGADQAGYNGQFRVLALTANTIQYKPDTAPSTSPSTGSTIQCKTPPMGGWEKVDEDTALERMALRRTAADASPHTFVFDNSVIREDAGSYQPGIHGYGLNMQERCLHKPSQLRTNDQCDLAGEQRLPTSLRPNKQAARIGR